MVYLLKRKSDLLPYVGITNLDRINVRMAAHRRDIRFCGIGFDMQILEQSVDKEYIETRESHWVELYDSYRNGLNLTVTGAGWSHKTRGNFNTIGFKYSKESRKKMSESGKTRVTPEFLSRMSEQSINLWNDPAYRAKQEGKRKGKRLRPPKLSDETVAEIRHLYETEKDRITQIIESINIERKKKGYSFTTPERYFANTYCHQYSVSSTLIRNIVCNTTRTKCFPPAYKS